MIKRILTIIVLAAAMFSCKQQSAPIVTNPLDSSIVIDKTPFPDFGFMVSNSIFNISSKRLPIFKLSQNYPDTLPTTPLPGFFKIDYKKDWHQYLDSVKSYCFEGNASAEVDFHVELNKVRKWYHMPWQHYGNQGREGFHGLTQEAPIAKFQLASTQTITTAGAVAVGFYNDVAAYTIGQVWKNHNGPDSLHNAAFNNGSVLFKLLFATIPEDEIKQVPSLVNGKWWDAYTAPDFTKGKTSIRVHQKVVLIQMDIMVRDTNAPNGWIFGNYQYNGLLKKESLKNGSLWDNMIPVGIMWGDDPTVTNNPTVDSIFKVTPINLKLTETIINPDATELPPTHLGWNGRLNGPVDNAMSSCYSCHATAEYPQLSPISPLFGENSKEPDYAPGKSAWMRWFKNLKCSEPFDTAAKSMDFSLQLTNSIKYFKNWKGLQAGLYASNYKTPSQDLFKTSLVTQQPLGKDVNKLQATSKKTTPPSQNPEPPKKAQKVYSSSIPLN